MSPPLPGPRCCRRVCDPELLPGYTPSRPLPPMPMGRSGRGSAGSFLGGLGMREGRRRGRGSHEWDPERPRALRADRGPDHAPTGRTLTAPKPANPGPSFSALSNHSRPFNQGAVPPISACPVTARPLCLVPLPGTPEAPLPLPPLSEPAELCSRCRSLGRRCWGREGRAGASSSGPCRDFSQGNGQMAGSGRSRPLQWRRREQGLRGPRGGLGAERGGNRRAGIGGAGAASGCDWLADPARGINSVRWGGTGVSSAVNVRVTVRYVPMWDSRSGAALGLDPRGSPKLQ
ncbi:translation initiation factor IF-2-like [Serinus canaria]|uniref:translation initiation factor IF-2-like n=1 Tax=Serinus canaria TaxID=9135 RepID=UPI0021CC6884|nr:translation initiation factor IF-2-like [Serinus canaria]